MRIAWIALVTSALVPVTAWATMDKPITAPAAAWVKPVVIPAVPVSADEAAIQFLLQDQQIAFEKGKTSIYSESVVRIAKPEGLGVGSLSFAWDPERQVPTVHKLLIRRGDKVIDVLGLGQTFTVLRRETNLDAATLDGVLTANIQPEGLQVGDVVDFAMTIESTDPILKDHVEAMGGGWNGVPVIKAHARVQWPASIPMRLRSTGDLPKLQAIRDGGTMSAEFTLDNVKPYVAPKGAPARYQLGRMIEATDYLSWAQLGTLMAPLYIKAAAIPAQRALRDELEKIRNATSDPKSRSEAALRLVQDRVRYVALLMGAGGYDPAPADVTWSRRYGDCKGKTALLLALLQALDVQAVPVLVSAPSGDGLEVRLPSAGLFNHVLVRATIGGRVYWLDGTRRGERSLERLPVPDYGWGLPLLAHNAALVRMTPAPLELPGDETTIRMDATAGLTTPAPVTIDRILRGDYAAGLNAALAGVSGEARDRGLRNYWRQQYNLIDVKDAKAIINLDTGETRLTMSGQATMDWSSGQYETDGTGVGYKADFQREPGPDVNAPFAVPYPIFEKVTETVQLPAGFAGHKASQSRDVDETVAGIHYMRETAFSDTTFTVTRTQRSVAPEFLAKDATAAQARLRELADSTIYIRRPADYRPNLAETSAAIAAKPDNAGGYIDRGLIHLDASEFDDAISDFSKAASLDPKSAWALADRGLAQIWKQNYAEAAKDLDAAEALDPNNPGVFRGRGIIAQQQGRYKDAIAAYDRSLVIDPGNRFTILRRISAYRIAGDDAAVLRETAAEIQKQSDWIDLYLTRANIFRRQGKQDAALAEAVAVTRSNPDSVYAHVTAARIYNAYAKREAAMAAYDRAIAIKPEAYIYLNRALSRLKTDLSGRRADIDAALQKEPDMADAMEAKAEMQKEAKDFDGAVATYSKAVSANPKDIRILVKRGITYVQAGKPALASRDFEQAKALASNASDLNEICWAKAQGGAALESALSECDAALAKEPGAPAILDSRALVLLRLNRPDEAMASYTAVLAKWPREANSLFGRALARFRKGDIDGARKDRQAALAVDPDVAKTYSAIGMDDLPADQR